MKLKRKKDFDFRLLRRGLIPISMESIKISAEEKKQYIDLALDIFVEASNHGQVFQEALLAVYLSGLNNGAGLGETQ
jgi:hypothetical protein